MQFVLSLSSCMLTLQRAHVLIEELTTFLEEKLTKIRAATPDLKKGVPLADAHEIIFGKSSDSLSDSEQHLCSFFFEYAGLPNRRTTIDVVDFLACAAAQHINELRTASIPQDKSVLAKDALREVFLCAFFLLTRCNCRPVVS